MIVLGERKQLFIGGWVIAALILIAYNGFNLSLLFSPPIVGRSKDARLASQKWLRYDRERLRLVDETVGKVDLEQVIQRFKPKIEVVVKQKKPIPAGKEGEPVVRAEIIPPELTGVMSIATASGQQRMSALMDGRQWFEKQHIREFYIQRITARGVLLAHDGKTWFLPTPQVSFSLDQGG